MSYSWKEPRYLSPLFITSEKIVPCTINVYRDTMIHPDHQQYIKSKFANDDLARLEPNKLWGTLLYRIRVKPHAKS